MTKPLHFDGPPESHCFGVPYVTLSIGGVKREGDPFEVDVSFPNVFHRLQAEIANYTKDAKQVAWREPPQYVNTDDGKITGFCRIAVFK